MRRIHLITLLVAAFGAGATASWLLLERREAAPASDTPAHATHPAKRQVLYWYDPMVPTRRFDQPGKSPFMDMQLLPKYADENGTADAGVVAIDPRQAQSLGVRTAKATLGSLGRTIRATGAVAWDERAVATVSAPVAAIVERLHVRAPLDTVEAGQALFTLLAPEWTAAQEEYLGLVRARAPGLEALRAAARQRLLLLGVGESQIRALERRGRSDPRIVVAAPRAGVLGELAVREGAVVSPGMPLARINGLETVWINAAIPEREAASVRAGTEVSAMVAALPGRRFAGRVEALLPGVDADTRTLTARIVVDNAQRLLAPGMYARLELAPAAAAQGRVLVPEEAVIATGTREVVIVVEGRGRFRAQEVRTGMSGSGQTEVLEGLDEGESVVLSGQFLLDSEASLKGGIARLQGTGKDTQGDESGEPP